MPRRLLAALMLSSMLAPLNSTTLSVILGRIGRELHVSERSLTPALVTSYLITSIVMQAPSGKLGDRFGHRRTLAVGQLLFAAGSIAAVFAPTLPLLALTRVTMAAGGALIIPSASALLRLELPVHVRGRAFGVFGASMALAAASGPILGGQIAEALSWRATFLVNPVLLAIAALLARGRAPMPRASFAGFRFDALGSLLLGGSLSAVVFASVAAGPLRSALFALAALLLIVFVAWERRHPEPVVDLRLLARPVFVAGGSIVALHNLAMYALLFEFPSLVVKLTGAAPDVAGRLLGSMMISMVLASPIAGRLTDRIGARTLAVTGCTFALAGLALMYVIPIRTPISAIPSLVVFGLGLGLAASPSQASAMSAVPREESGMAGAMLATMRYVGGVAGIVGLGMVWTASADPAMALVEHHRALGIFGLALALAIGCATVLPREAPSESAR